MEGDGGGGEPKNTATISTLQGPDDEYVLSSEKQDVATRIQIACEDHDIRSLTDIAASPHGFIDDVYRCVAWPVLLGCSGPPVLSEVAWQSLPSHRDEDQVRLDVNRSFVYYPKNESQGQLDCRKAELSDLIIETLRRHPSLCYFQGYHDIVQVFLLVLGREQATVPVARLSLLRIRDFMLPTLSPTFSHLDLLPRILHVADLKLERHLSQTQPFFALAATLTLYAHDIQEYGDIARLFDFLLGQEASVSIYLFAIIILSRKDELLEIEPDEPEMLHSILSKLPKPLNLEKLIADTMDLFHRHPPEMLATGAWRRISSYSVLKTTRDPSQLARQTLQDGERLLLKQARQLRIMQMLAETRSKLWKLRQPTGALGLAVLIGVLSWWLQRDSSSLVSKFWTQLKIALVQHN